MKRLSEYENEDAIELLADIIEPASTIFLDKELKKAYESKKTKMPKLISIALKNNASSVVQILARLEGVEPKDYKGNIVSMTKALMEIANDKDMIDFFQSLGQTEEQKHSTSALESTEE